MRTVLKVAAWLWWDDLALSSQAEYINTLPLLESLFSSGVLLTLAIVGGLITTAIAVVLIRARIALIPIDTTSSEMNNSWRYDLHPRQVFTTLRDFVLMQRRELELPNRVYVDKNDTSDANRDN